MLTWLPRGQINVGNKWSALPHERCYINVEQFFFLPHVIMTSIETARFPYDATDLRQILPSTTALGSHTHATAIYYIMMHNNALISFQGYVHSPG